MKHIKIATKAIVVLSLLSISNQASSEAATQIRFAKGSFCCSYTGDFSRGKKFVLGLGKDQRFTSRNTGDETQYDAYLVGSTGKLSGQKVSNDEIDYIIPSRGNYEIFVFSSGGYGSVEFCAY
ncbi:MAG: hypothetical protein NTV00_01085 [Methylococcales bacterium]|nr:hypothetical protein [Methylococcales bacterium]